MSDYYDWDNGGRQNPPPRKPENNRGWYSWPLIIVFFSIGLWPVALVLLAITLFGKDGKKAVVQGESTVERAMRRAEERASGAARRAAEQVDRAAERVDRAVRQADGAARGAVNTAGRVTEQAIQRARQEAEAAVRMVLHGGRRDFDEMAQILNTALDKAKALAELERRAAQERQQSQGTPQRGGYADARPQPNPRPVSGPRPGPVNMGANHRNQNPNPVPNQNAQKNAKPQKQKKLKLPGKGLRVLGIIFLVFGSILGLDFLASVAQGYSVDFEQFFMSLGFLAGGGLMFGRGKYLANMTRRSQRYILAIGNTDAMSMEEIAKRVNRKPAQAAKELQKLIDKGYLGEDAYIDRERGYFLRFGATLEDETPPPAPERQEEEPAGDEGSYAGVLRGIRRANQRIADPALSRKIARIEQVTALILKEVEVHPEKRERLNMFFDYYLPTTQKLLDTYADFEATGVEGANLRQAKARIAETMDAIVAGFERQLDHLYSADAMDIAADIQVMEAMLNQDGATASQEFGFHDSDEKDSGDDDPGFRPLQL